MKLPTELVSKFAKLTKAEKPKTETIVYGTIEEEELEDGTVLKFLNIDGSDVRTPIATTVDMVAGERVTAMIKNHTAIVTGNITSPAARSETVNKVVTGQNTNYARLSKLGELLLGDLREDDELLYNVFMDSLGAYVRFGETNLAKFSEDIIEVGDAERTLNLYGNMISYYINGVMTKPYYSAGDEVTFNWFGTGYTTSTSNELQFSIPLAKPVVGSPNVTMTSVDGFIVRRNGSYIYGSSASGFVSPTSYTATVSPDGGFVNITAKFGSSSNAASNYPCGIQASIKLTFS